MSPETLGLVSLAALFVGICVGFPISFTLMFLGVVFGYIGFGDTVFFLMVIQTFGVMREPLLAAVPLFLFMGFILEQAGLMDRLFTGFRMLLANVKGSLYIAVLVTATLFAAATGIVGASVTILGVMAAPIMKQAGYDVRLSAGSIAAGGTLGMLIPPSIMLVVMGPVVGVPITELFAAAVIPGVMLAGLYILYAVARSYLNPALGPPLPVEERSDSVGAILKELVIGIIPFGGPDSIGFGQHSGRSCNTHRRCCHGGGGRFSAVRCLPSPDLGWAEKSGVPDHAGFEHDPVPGRHIQLLRRRFCPPRHSDDDRREPGGHGSFRPCCSWSWFSA